MSTIITETPQQRAERGALLLDEVKPGWAELIDISTLDVRDWMKCVLGQVYGSYGKGITTLWPHQTCLDDIDRDHGFDTFVPSEYRQLTEVWSELVKHRKQGKTGEGE